MESFGLLLGGVVCAAIGRELFVRGVVGLAVWARVSAGIIAATFAAFATSSPELSVSVSSALAGTPQIALGDALGSNVVNLALILGLALLISPIRATRDSLRRDFSVAFFAPLLLGVLAYDGMLSRADGIVLLVMFVAWLVAVVLEVRRQRSAAGRVLGEVRHGVALLSGLLGLVFLVTSGKLIVWGAKGIALAYGIDEFVIGATLVAVGTSAPELATVLIARLRGHDEVGLGTLLGSSIFNALFIVGVAASIYPIAISLTEVAIGLLLGLLATALVFPGKSGHLGRERGWMLLALYATYLGLILKGEIA
jgi:cation:H+ antiporter